jgi:hypothetical protein
MEHARETLAIYASLRRTAKEAASIVLTAGWDIDVAVALHTYAVLSP